MLLICPHSGLGNQIGNYVFAQSLIEKGFNVKFLMTCEKNPDRAFVLDKFNTGLTFASNEEIKIFLAQKTPFLSYKFLFKNILFNRKIYFNSLYKILAGIRARYNIYPKKTPSFLSKIVSYEDVLKYGLKDGAICDCYSPIEEFNDEDFKNKMRGHFVLREPLDERNRMVFDKIKSFKDSIGVHIRRGDYLKLKIPVVKPEFLFEKMDFMNNNFEKSHFFVFSDDINWAKEKLQKYKNINFIDINDESSGYLDFILMNECRHRIYSASSFSKWLRYLNPNTDSVEFMPDSKDLIVEP